MAKSLSANLGETNLLKPLSDLFSIKPIFYHRIVFILRDGEIKDTVNNIDLSRSNSKKKKKKNQCFTIGFGKGCDVGHNNKKNEDENHIEKLKLNDKQLEDKSIATLMAIAALHNSACDSISSWKIIEEKYYHC